MPSCAIITPWQNHLELADDYFEAVDTANPDQLVVVDDGSDPPLDFAATRIERAGFCTATNAGLELVETEYVLLLNNDVKMRNPGWLAAILDLVEPGVVVGPLRGDPHAVVDGVLYEYADGWCAAFYTDDLRRLGGFDERYDAAGPAYFSDTHLSLLARWHGLTLRDLSPGLAHKGGQTGGVDTAKFQHALQANGELFQADVRTLVG